MGRLILLCALVIPVPEWRCLPDGTCLLEEFNLKWAVKPAVITKEEQEYDHRFLKDPDPFNYPSMDEIIDP